MGKAGAVSQRVGAGSESVNKRFEVTVMWGTQPIARLFQHTGATAGAVSSSRQCGRLRKKCHVCGSCGVYASQRAVPFALLRQAAGATCLGGRVPLPGARWQAAPSAVSSRARAQTAAVRSCMHCSNAAAGMPCSGTAAAVHRRYGVTAAWRWSARPAPSSSAHTCRRR